MSIIEKAVKRLDVRGRKASQEPAPSEPVVASSVAQQNINEVPAQSAAVSSFTAEPKRADESKARVDIPLARLASQGMVSPSAPRSTIAEEYRGIKRPLLMNINGQTAAEVKYPNLWFSFLHPA